MFLQRNYLKKVEAAALKGNWILISSENLKFFWNDGVDKLLIEMRRAKLITNSFRLLFDFQTYNEEFIPKLSNKFVFFYLSSINMEDLEGNLNNKFNLHYYLIIEIKKKLS